MRKTARAVIINDNNYYEIRWLSLDKLDNSGIRAMDLVKKVMNYED